MSEAYVGDSRIYLSPKRTEIMKRQAAGRIVRVGESTNRNLTEFFFSIPVTTLPRRRVVRPGTTRYKAWR